MLIRQRRSVTDDILVVQDGEISASAKSAPLQPSGGMPKRPEKRKPGVAPPLKVPPLPEGPRWETEEQSTTDPKDLPHQKGKKRG